MDHEQAAEVKTIEGRVEGARLGALVRSNSNPIAHHR